MPQANLRRCARLKAEVAVNCRIIGAAKARQARIKSCNSSIAGICLTALDHCKLGARVGLEIFLESGNPVKVEGTVVWHKRFEDGACRAGVRFMNLKEEDKERFSNFIFRKMYEMTGMGDRPGLVKYAKEHCWDGVKE